MRLLERLLRVATLGVLGIMLGCAAPSQPAATADGAQAILPTSTPSLVAATATIPAPTAQNPTASPVLATVTPVSTAQSSSQLRPEVGTTQIKVMSFNIWIGGAVIDSSQVPAVIREVGADIVGLQEAEGNTAQIAAALGWHASERTMIISRFPLIEPPTAEGSGVDYVYAQIAPGQVVAVANIHLTSDPYGPYAVRDGKSLDEVLAQEGEVRLPEIKDRLAAWQEVAAAGIPLFITGDFNSPSHRDWTAATVGVLPHMRYAVPWPVTTAVEAAGFVDTFRAAHPDPVSDPGRTWTYGYPYPRRDANETVDRIDFVFASPAAQVLSSAVVGETGTPNVDIGVSPYPSDHRAVVSTIQVDPVEPPVFVAVEHVRVQAGERLVVRYHAPDGDATDRLALVPAGGTIPDAELMWLPPQEAEYFGAVRFGTGGLASGEYAVVLVGADNKELSRSRFWVVAPAALPTIQVSKPAFALGEGITLTWQNAPAHMRDWVAIYPAGSLDLYNGYLAYTYTGATVAGQHTFSVADIGGDALPPGEYVATLSSDDGYAVLAQVPFTVSP